MGSSFARRILAQGYCSGQFETEKKLGANFFDKKTQRWFCAGEELIPEDGWANEP